MVSIATTRNEQEWQAPVFWRSTNFVQEKKKRETTFLPPWARRAAEPRASALAQPGAAVRSRCLPGRASDQESRLPVERNCASPGRAYSPTARTGAARRSRRDTARAAGGLP